MNFYQLIENRRSIRVYDESKDVPVETLRRIVEAGRLAPTATNAQPARMILVTNKETLKQVAPCFRKEGFKNATALLVLVGKRENAWQRKEDGFSSLEIDCAIMMDHMILAAESEGVATCWIISFNQPPLRTVLEIEDHEEIICLTPLGYPPDGFVKPVMPPRKSLDQMVTFVE